MAQKNNNYSKQWTIVEGHERKGLTKSALAAVLDIYKLSLKEGNTAQQIKTSIYQIKYRNILEENSNENNIFFIDTLIAAAKTPAKNILQSMQAGMFWQYLQNNRWKFYNRTQIADEKATDISTWSLQKLHATITALYQASLTNETVLKQTKLTGYEAILIKGENTRQLRPTLFDFLAHRALDYYVTDERNITKPAYQFTINDEKAFSPAAKFSSTSLQTKDTAALHYHALNLFKKLLTFHRDDTSLDALLDADLRRLVFVNQYAINENKTALYEAALKALQENYTTNTASAQAMYLRASIYYSKGQNFDPFTNTSNQYELKRALELCEAAIRKFPASEGGINALNLKNQILQPTLNLETEQVNVTGQPFRTLVTYKNVTTVYFRIIKTSRNEINKMDRREYDKIWQNYVALKPLKSWRVALPDLRDYQEHATEIKIDGVDNGVYFLLASIDANFSLQKNIIAKQVVHVSNISFIHNDASEYFVLNRETGEPLAGATGQAWEAKYNYTNNSYDDVKLETYTADQNGYFKLKKAKDYRNFRIQFLMDKDELFLEDMQHNEVYGADPVESSRPISFIFTDRSIYRPGQTIYFKGIMLKNGNKTTKATVLPDVKTAVYLKDANGQKIGEFNITTNAYGSYHGTFKLPEGSLNGQFSLLDTTTSATQYFSVEEYKRPKFFTEIKKPAGTYRVNDSIKVIGSAKAYAGNMVDGAAVKYRVVRKVRYPIWWDYGFSRKGGRSMPWGRNEEMEITNGTTNTDAMGTFTITFKALPDESINKKDQPTFYYEVSADVTDLNGETRSGETTVAVAYQSLQLTINVADKIPADSLKTLLVRSTNLNDLEEKTIVTLSMQRLKSPGKVFRDRYWNQPDQFVMSKDDYYSYFPHDVYQNENEVKHYELGDKIFEKTDSSNQQWAITNKPEPGWYKLVATSKDKYGETIRAEKYLQLTGAQITEATGPITVNVSKSTAEPGDKISYQVNTGFQKIWLVNALQKMNDAAANELKMITPSSPLSQNIEVTENDRGGMALTYAFVKYNRVYSGTEGFKIPWSNKDLNISYTTFRDKLLPEAQEKWTVKISGNKGEKVAAEMLAGMYDASLDQFIPHSWNALNIFPTLYNAVRWSNDGFEEVNSEEHENAGLDYSAAFAKSYDRLLSSDEGNYGGGRFNRSKKFKNGRNDLSGSIAMAAPMDSAKEMDALQMTVPKPVSDDTDGDGVPDQSDKEPNTPAGSKVNGQGVASGTNPPDVQIRKNFNETAFFFPELTTDADGNISFSATLPEALTEWKLMTLAHTKDLASRYAEKTLVTQKPLMVQPNAPRFMREGDRMEFSAKIVNLSDNELTGTTTLELLDAATNKPIDGWFKNVFPNQYFTVAAGQSTVVKFPVEIPFNFNSALTYRIVATSTGGSSVTESFSDGEEMTLPILTNRMLVTESMPINLRGNELSKKFTFEKLLASGTSNSLQQHALTVEYTSNPAWYAVQALPYLMEYPYDCAEQTFNRYYANALATYVSNSIPRIKTIFERWRTTDTAALLSNLQKNEELKSALLAETPWVLDAQNEAQQKKNIGLLFDMVKMGAEATKAIAKLTELQTDQGGFVWFKGGPDDRYMTQYILTGIGHLDYLNALPSLDSKLMISINNIVKKGLPYLDKKIKEDYDALIKQKANLKNNNLGSSAIQYLYMRSFFGDNPVPAATQKAYQYYLAQSKRYWLNNSKYMQAMIALIMHRNKDALTAAAIIKSLKENSINHQELGMYWKEWNNRGWFWYQAPIESQAMMIEAFTAIDKDAATIGDLKTWLLKQKQTQNWGTTKATAEACYALLLSDKDWLAAEREVTIVLGNKSLSSANQPVEAGTGYFKEKIESKSITPEMGNITISVKANNNNYAGSGSGGSWGAVYWQYFEDLDKITTASTPLKLVKKLFIERNGDKGPELIAVTEGASLKVGDKIKVRIELRVDRDMEYVHMKDMRAACMEPVNVLSGYKYQGGLGYYESTKDASTNFFFSWLNKGTYVFEYPLFVTHAGDFSNGITSIQCMYAPEFASHSEGIRVTVEK